MNLTNGLWQFGPKVYAVQNICAMRSAGWVQKNPIYKQDKVSHGLPRISLNILIYLIYNILINFLPNLCKNTTLNYAHPPSDFTYLLPHGKLPPGNLSHYHLFTARLCAADFPQAVQMKGGITFSPPEEPILFPPGSCPVALTRLDSASPVFPDMNPGMSIL